MFRCAEQYSPAVDDRYTEKITSLLVSPDRTLIGREDGVVEGLRAPLRFEVSVFARSFDSLENDTVKEQVTCMARMPGGGVSEVFFFGNERSISVQSVRGRQATLNACRGDEPPAVVAAVVKQCPNIHSYVLNSLSLNLEATALISADFLRINLWSPSRMNAGFCLVDLKAGKSPTDISFVINTALFSPFADSLFGWSTSSGEISLHDLSIAPRSARVATFSAPKSSSLRSVSDFVFVDGNLVLGRTLNSIFLADIRRPESAVFSKELITEKAELELMNTTDAIYQTFKIASDGVLAYTGSCFGTVFSVDMLSGEHEEVLVAPQRAFNHDRRIKHVAHDGTGALCAYNGALYRLAPE